MEETTEQPAVAGSGTETTPDTSAPAADSGAAADLEAIGERLKGAVRAEAGVAPSKPEQQPKQGQQAAKPAKEPAAEGKPAQAQQAAGEFKPVEYKANGKVHRVESEADLRRLLAAGHDYTRSKQELAEKRKPYEILDREIDKDQSLGVIVKRLTFNPRIRAAVLQVLDKWEQDGAIHPAEYEAAQLRTQQEMAQQFQQQEQVEQQQAEGRRLLDQHLAEIGEDLGEQIDVNHPYVREVWQFMQANGLRDLKTAHKLYQVESGQYEKRLMEKAQQQQSQNRGRLLTAQGARVPRQSAGGTQVRPQAADLDAIGARLKAVIGQQ